MGNEFVIRECRLQDPTNRQNSVEIETDPSIQLDASKEELVTEWRRRQHGIINQAKGLYEWAIENGIAKEQARCVLPEEHNEPVPLQYHFQLPIHTILSPD